MQGIDLHVHSVCSDGSYTPTELVEYAIKKNLKAFALTDHDTIDGLAEAFEAAKGKPVEVIPGIELSTEYQLINFYGQKKGIEVHIVGLFLDYQNQEFLDQLTYFQDSRDHRNEKMCRNLQEAGIDITFEKLQEENPGAVITRAHYASYMLKHGYVKTREQAFARYLGDHTPYFVGREKISPVQAIELIRKAGGVAILAHPLLYHLNDDDLDGLVSHCKEHGLQGIEVYYSTHTPAGERYVRRIAEKFDLLMSGGSDFHGVNKEKLDLGTGYGKLFVPEDILEPIRRASGNYEGTV